MDIIKLKADIFDLQVQYAKVRQQLEIKLKELNDFENSLINTKKE